MNLYEKILQIYPELTDNDFRTVIILQNDLDEKERMGRNMKDFVIMN